MHSSVRRARGGLGAAISGLNPTIGPDVTSRSVTDRVSSLGLTSSTLAPRVESRIRQLLEDILQRGQYAENSFELVAYTCALEKENDARLLGLTLDLVFEMVKGNGEVAPMLGRLFLIFRQELLPGLRDARTYGPDGSPLTGYSLFAKYLLDRCRKELDAAWVEKEKAKDASGDINKTVKHWFTLVDLVNDLRKRFLIDDSIVHEAIERQMTIVRLTVVEVSILIVLLSPAKPDVKSFTARNRVESHYSQLRRMVKDERIDYEIRERLQESVLNRFPDRTTTTSTPAGPDENLGRDYLPIQEANASTPTDEHFKRGPKLGSVKVTESINTLESGQTSASVLGRAKLHDTNKFYVNSQTPIVDIITFFTQVAQPAVVDLTSALQAATFSDDPISTTALSDVWKAMLRNGLQVAVKCVKSTVSGNDKAVKHTVRELSAWSQQRHTNILQLLGIALYKGRLAMVSEWMELGSVVNVVSRRPDIDRYDLCVQVAGVVAWLHSQSLIHGDLKGANILISDSGVPKLTDFGLAVMDESVLQFSETLTGGGTMRWMAPELFQEDARKSFKTDVYALGMTILEILTGQEPFPEITTPHGIIKAVSVERRIPSRPMCLKDNDERNEGFWDAMVKCWVYNPRQRPTAEDVEKLLSSAGGGEGLMKSVSGKRSSTCSGCTLA